MNILTKAKNSIYNAEYYKSLPESESLGGSIKYLVRLCLLVSLISLIIFSVEIPGFYHAVKNSINSIAASYPDDLVVLIKNGIASINKPEPYIVPASNPAQNNMKNGKNNYNNYFVIDTTKPFSSPQFEEYSAFAWLTKTELVVIKNSNQIQILPLAKMGNWEINKAWILQKEAYILKILPWLIPVLVIMIYIAYFLANFAGTLIILFLYALIVWLISKIKKGGLSYKNSYKISIHAVTLLIILGIFSGFFSILDNFFLKLIIFVILIYINYFKNYEIGKESVPVSVS